MIGSGCRSAVSVSVSPTRLPPPKLINLSPRFPAKFRFTSQFRHGHSRRRSSNLTPRIACYPPNSSTRTNSCSCKALCLIHEDRSSSSSSISSSTTTTTSSFNGEVKDKDFVVVNFYRFVFIKDPQFEVSKHLSFLQDQGLDIHGRIYLNEQGINAQYSGPSADAIAYLDWLREDQRFSDILVQISPALSGHAFPRLKLRYKPSLVQLEGGNLDLPLLDPSMRATPLAPAEWRKRLELVNNEGDALNRDPHQQYILLDVRNGYEWDVGHFSGAVRPEVDCFRSTSFGLSELEVPFSDPLATMDKEKTNILMYCTGGIRCDIYSTILRQRGFQKLYTLQGGVSHYLQKEGPVKWAGNLFVFDSRLSLSPSTFATGSAEASRIPIVPKNNRFARCYVCGLQVHELRHRNCANLDCNLLFICCGKCVEEHRGCCCSNCMTAPRLRPVLQGNQRYKKWHHYRDDRIK
ncbi:Rhodanese-like domain-containing protein 8, chloroplastic [Dionaea muscipula]